MQPRPISAKLREPAMRDEGAASLLRPHDAVSKHRRGGSELGRRHDPQGHHGRVLRVLPEAERGAAGVLQVMTL